LIELPEVSCQLFCGYKRIVHFSTDPQELPFKIPRSLDIWSLALDYDGFAETPLFDCERVVVYRSSERCPWRSTDQIGLVIDRIPISKGEHFVLLGPGWEGNAVDLYWGLIRKAILLNRQTRPLLAMVYESALAGSK